jgi:signal transduction histidine kinase/CheY-like chemotaxis protein/HPt (histidine-containing phosphotransfer) domain-containing protein
MWIVNCILLIVGTVAAVMGISFYIRNREASGKIRLIIFSYGISSALWCLSYGLVGIAANPDTCEILRKFGIIGFETFFFTEVILATEMSGVRRSIIVPVRWSVIAVCVIDFIFFAQSGVDTFIREDNWTTWHFNPEYRVNQLVHTGFIIYGFLVLITFWFIWNHNSKLKRLRRFLFMALVSNCSLFIFMLPDFFLPMMGERAVSTSGLGGAVCAIVMWYGATRLVSFDIRMGNIKDKIFNFMEAGIIVMDTDHQIAMINRYAGQLTEKKVKEGLDLADIFEMEPGEREKIFADADADIYYGRFWDKNGSHAYSVRAQAVKDNYGDTFCYMCVFLDVTDEVATANRLEIASQAKSRFLAQMSHEIRTPINAVLGMNEMILREAKNPEILDYAENIDSAGNTLLSLINSILDFSKIEDGKMDIIPVQYDTASLVNDLVNSVLQKAESKGLAFNVNIDKNLPCAMIGDDVRVSQVIMNLLTNAVKYTEKGFVTLAIKEEERTWDKVRLQVSVKDTGIGIHQEDIDKLFVSFERLDEVRNHNIEGTGLGISIVKSLLTMMGSRLEVESTYGEGSKFSFVIEQGISDATPIGDYGERAKKNRQEKGRAEVIWAPNAEILVVDDNQMNLKVARNLLKLSGIAPELVSSGEGTIERMRKKKYDIVFLDHMMPGMDGIETLKRLMEEDLIPDETTVIALTANAVVGSREKYLEAGFTDYLSKPIEMKELVRLLKLYLPERAYEDPEGSEAVREISETEGAAESQGTKDKEARKETAFGKTADPDMEVMEFFPGDDSDVMEFLPGEGSDFFEGSISIDNLKQLGLDTESALSYCGGDEGFYVEMIRDFLKDCGEKTAALEEYYAEKNWHQYNVQVHSMKSNLKTLGATAISEKARLLEVASGEEDETYLAEHHEELLKECRKLVEDIEQICS